MNFGGSEHGTDVAPFPGGSASDRAGPRGRGPASRPSGRLPAAESSESPMLRCTENGTYYSKYFKKLVNFGNQSLRNFDVMLKLATLRVASASTMRPRPSPENMRLALHFANAITRKKHGDGDPNLSIERNGDTSIHSLLRKCCQSCGEGKPLGISELQLNKHLSKNGYVSVRQRNRIKGTKDQWEKGYFRWHNRCWVDPIKEEAHLRFSLYELERLASPGKIWTHRVIIILMETVHGSCGQMIAREQLRPRHRIVLDEPGLQPWTSLRNIRPEIGFLALFSYQVLIRICGRCIFVAESDSRAAGCERERPRCTHARNATGPRGESPLTVIHHS